MRINYSGIVHTAELYLQFYEMEVKNILSTYKSYIVKEDSKKFTLEINDLTITFIKATGYTTVKIDFIKLLNNPNVLPDDINIIYKKISDVILPMCYYQKDLVLKRFDFRFDVKLYNKEEVDLIFKLYEKTVSKIYTLKKSKYEDSLYYKSSSKHSSLSINIYRKDKERIAKGKEPVSYEENLIRYEVQLRNRHLNYRKYAKKYDKHIETYLNADLMQYYFNRYIKPICYSGNYCDIYRAKKIICTSIKSKAQQDKIINFLTTISRFSIDKAKESYSSYEFNKIIGILEELNINPILIPKHLGLKQLKNPLSMFFSEFPFE